MTTEGLAHLPATVTGQLALWSAEEVAPPNAWCQRWADGGHRWRHRSQGGFDPARYRVAPISEAAAKSYVERHHYTHTYPAARLRFGLLEGDDLVGVAVFSVPVQHAVLTRVFPDLEPCYESVELGRFVLADRVAANAETWMLARTFDALAGQGVRGIVSFADPVPRRTADGALLLPGHIGRVYQAKSAKYLGRGAASTLLLLPDGTSLNARALAKVRAGDQGEQYVMRRLSRYGAPARRVGESGEAWLARALPAVGARRVRHPGCHRYGFVLGTKQQRRCVRVAMPACGYPKLPDPEPITVG